MLVIIKMVQCTKAQIICQIIMLFIFKKSCPSQPHVQAPAHVLTGADGEFVMMEFVVKIWIEEGMGDYRSFSGRWGLFSVSQRSRLAYPLKLQLKGISAEAQYSITRR